MADRQSITGNCLCGQSPYEFLIEASQLPLQTSICHCNTCRHNSGVLAVFTVNLPGISLSSKSDGVILDSLQQYRTSKHVSKWFCQTCGTHIFESDQRDTEPMTWAVYSGTLDKFNGLTTVSHHAYIGDTVDGGLSEGLSHIDNVPVPRFLGSRQESKAVTTRESRSHSSQRPDRLHAHCVCKGVSFYISPPSPQSAGTDGPYPDVLLPYYVKDRPEGEKWWLRANGTKYLAGICTCNSCRLGCGSEFQQWAFVPTCNISLASDGSVPFGRDFGTLNSYRSSDGATRHFCSDCGATVFWDGNSRPEIIDVSVGLLDAEEGARAERWLEWRTERISYREDAVDRAGRLVHAMEHGLADWGRREEGRTKLASGERLTE